MSCTEGKTRCTGPKATVCPVRALPLQDPVDENTPLGTEISIGCPLAVGEVKPASDFKYSATFGQLGASACRVATPLAVGTLLNVAIPAPAEKRSHCPPTKKKVRLRPS